MLCYRVLCFTDPFLIDSQKSEESQMSRTVFQIFETYQQARTSFVQTVAELAHRPQNIDALTNAGVMVSPAQSLTPIQKVDVSRVVWCAVVIAPVIDG